MATISNDYPFSISDQDLEVQIQGLVTQIREHRTTDETLNLTESQILQFISLGQSELQSRINKKTNLEIDLLKNLIDQDSKNAKKVSTASLRYSSAALIIALLTLFASTYFSIRGENSDKEWQDQEIRTLQIQNQKITEQSLLLVKYLKLFGT